MDGLDVGSSGAGERVVVAPGRLNGLTEREARERRERGEGNVAPLSSSRSYLQILGENLFTFVNSVLLGLGIVLVLLGRSGDTVVSLGIVLINVAVGVAQEVRAKRTLDRIALLMRPRVTAIRDGQERELDPAEIVVGDVLVAGPGDQIVVDGRLIGAGRVEVDESLLTGEADPVPKALGDAVWSGSFVVAGRGAYEAEKVGTETVAFRLSLGARAFRRVQTPLQREVRRLVRIILVVAAFLGVLLAASAIIHGIPTVEMAQRAVVVLGLVPNGLFLAVAVAYALGAVRIAGRGVLVQQANAIESLSNVDVLCLDKTGTLTSNRLSVQELIPFGLSEAELKAALGDYAASATAGNRTIEAIRSAWGGQRQSVRAEVPFSSQRKWSALTLDGPAGAHTYVLGAPDVLSPQLQPAPGLAHQVDAWSARGLRVVLFASAPEQAFLDDGLADARLPAEMVPLGLVGLADAVRPDAMDTLADFARAGIHLKIISGDHPETVAAVARQAGFAAEHPATSGLDLAQMDPSRLGRVAEETSIFGRITPQQKADLIRALRERGHYVAMVGDGINDVLALKEAQLGVALNGGSQAARAVADLVLLDDAFSVLPRAFLEGQRIVNGMRDVLKLFLTRVLYVTLLIVSVGLVADGFPFAPKHSSLFVLFTVGLPTLALAAWAEPGRPSRTATREIARFVVPAAVTLSLAALGVFVGVLAGHTVDLLAHATAADRLSAFDDAQVFAQSAVTTFSVLAGLLLIPFAKPPTRRWAVAAPLANDWRPTLAAAGLLVGYVAILAIKPLGAFFELWTSGTLLGVAAALVWGLITYGLWRARLLERLLDLAS